MNAKEYLKENLTDKLTVTKFTEIEISLIERMMEEYLALHFIVNCSTCKHIGVSKYLEPCFGCNEFSNHQLKTN